MFDTGNLSETSKPVTQFLGTIVIILSGERIQQLLADMWIEQAQRQGLPITQLQRLSIVVRVLFEQVAGAYPATFQGPVLRRARWPSVTKELHRRQLGKYGTIVVRHLDVLTRLEQPLRIIEHTIPGGDEQQWSGSLVIGAPNKTIEHCKPCIT
ncbi:hypothetical protein D3C80_1507850 [compost metagenome]